MLRLLFDTHVLLALLRKTLTQQYPAVIKLMRRDVERHASVVSLWEIAIKSRLGKLDPGVPPEDQASFFERAGVAILNVNRDHAVTFVEPEPATRDPFDRMLLSQCKVEGLKLVTFDRVLASHPLAFQIAT